MRAAMPRPGDCMLLSTQAGLHSTKIAGGNGGLVSCNALLGSLTEAHLSRPEFGPSDRANGLKELNAVRSGAVPDCIKKLGRWPVAVAFDVVG